MQELLNRYMKYVGESESPANYHRWAFISCLSAAIGRRAHFPMGHFRIYPNLFVMLMGDPGARKNTAINIARDILKSSGFARFAGGQISKERFYMDLAESAETDLHSISQQFICAPEFNNFIGEGNTGFIKALTALFDPEPFDAKFKNSKSSLIEHPCVGLLGGNTQQGFAAAFPPSIIHDGFLSRLILIWGMPTGLKLFMPSVPDTEERSFFIQHFEELLQFGSAAPHGSVQLGITPEAKEALREIYLSWKELQDGRFVTYAQRRYTHFLKLCVISAASVGKLAINYEDVVFSNTLLYIAERHFTRALGEFGKAKNAEEASIVMNALYNTKKPLTIGDLWQKLQTNLQKFSDLQDILTKLVAAKKIIHIHDKFVASEVETEKMPHINHKLFPDALEMDKRLEQQDEQIKRLQNQVAEEAEKQAREANEIQI